MSLREKGAHSILSWWGILGIALVLGGMVSLYASSFPDGLEHVASLLGFTPKEQSWFGGFFSRYTAPGTSSDVGAIALSKILGTLGVFGALLILGRALSPKDEKKSASDMTHHA